MAVQPGLCRIWSETSRQVFSWRGSYKQAPVAQVIEHPLRDREVVGLIPGRAIPKALKMIPVAALLGAQHYEASTGFSSANIYRTTNIASLTNKSEKSSLIIIIVCIHQRTVWRIGSHAKYVSLVMSPQPKGGGHIVFGADPVGIHVASFPGFIY